MEVDTNEFIELLDNYLELEKNIKGIKNPEALRESKDYRALGILKDNLKGYVLNSNEIIEIYKHVKNIAERNYNFREEEYKSKINDLEEVVSNLENSKNNLKDLILNPNNFFNGKIIEEIKKEY